MNAIEFIFGIALVVAGLAALAVWLSSWKVKQVESEGKKKGG
jgi:hypothetical protein